MNLKTSSYNLFLLIVVAVLVDSTGLFSPVLNSNDAYFYAIISKNILLQHDWINLSYAGADWLDKPHIPFWLTAISFKLFGITPFAYVLPGFLFHLLGAYYTFRLAKLFYSHEVGLIAALIYVTSLHLMLSAMDVRAEAYLLGEIMPACYYWLLYERVNGIKNLLFASVFTALALMTKGIFVVITIFSGIFAIWIYTRRVCQIIAPKWLIAYLLTLIFILPEIIALYMQFDLHPEKVVFGHNHVSGVAWYFWGSQFGRFFNNGPIVNSRGNPFFFVHTFLWAFLPWTIIFISAVYQTIRNFKTHSGVEKINLIYLHTTFWLTFILFSATKFQLDHYTNIIMPFAAIICAKYLVDLAQTNKLSTIQLWLSRLILLLIILITLIVFKISWYSSFIIIPIIILIQSFHLNKLLNNEWYKLILIPSCAILITFSILTMINQMIFPIYNNGYNIARALTNEPDYPVYIHEVPELFNSLLFHSNHTIWETAQRPTNYPYYMIIKDQDLDYLRDYNYNIIGRYGSIQLQAMIPSLFNDNKLKSNLIFSKLLLVKGKK